MMSLTHLSNRSLVISLRCFIAALLVTPALTQSYAAWQTPLSEQDKSAVSIQAITQFQSNRRAAVKSEDTLALGAEVLLVELQEKKNRKPTDARLAEVFVFDYTTNDASVQLINVDTLDQISIKPVSDIHLPLNEKETEWAKKILLNEESLLDRIRQEYLTAFGHELTTLSQIDMKVSIWEPGSFNSNASVCIQTRCALVSVFTHDHFNFSIEPVVVLRSATVHLDLIQ